MTTNMSTIIVQDGWLKERYEPYWNHDGPQSQKLSTVKKANQLSAWKEEAFNKIYYN